MFPLIPILWSSLPACSSLDPVSDSTESATLDSYQLVVNQGLAFDIQEVDPGRFRQYPQLKVYFEFSQVRQDIIRVLDECETGGERFQRAYDFALAFRRRANQESDQDFTPILDALSSLVIPKASSPTRLGVLEAALLKIEDNREVIPEDLTMQMWCFDIVYSLASAENQPAVEAALKFANDYEYAPDVQKKALHWLWHKAPQKHGRAIKAAQYWARYGRPDIQTKALQTLGVLAPPRSPSTLDLAISLRKNRPGDTLNSRRRNKVIPEANSLIWQLSPPTDPMSTPFYLDLTNLPPGNIAFAFFSYTRYKISAPEPIIESAESYFRLSESDMIDKEVTRLESKFIKMHSFYVLVDAGRLDDSHWEIIEDLARTDDFGLAEWASNELLYRSKSG